MRGAAYSVIWITVVIPSYMASSTANWCIFVPVPPGLVDGADTDATYIAVTHSAPSALSVWRKLISHIITLPYYLLHAIRLAQVLQSLLMILSVSGHV